MSPSELHVAYAISLHSILLAKCGQIFSTLDHLLLHSLPCSIAGLKPRGLSYSHYDFFRNSSHSGKKSTCFGDCRCDIFIHVYSKASVYFPKPLLAPPLLPFKFLGMKS